MPGPAIRYGRGGRPYRYGAGSPATYSPNASWRPGDASSGRHWRSCERCGAEIELGSERTMCFDQLVTGSWRVPRTGDAKDGPNGLLPQEPVEPMMSA